MQEALEVVDWPRPSGTLFTVGVPVFNGRSLLRNCLQSVLNSTLPRHRFEIVIADDGSSEPETLAILGEFQQALQGDPGFFRVISLGINSGGAARPRNRILEEATGEYVFFVDADDTIGTLTLERTAEALATTPADWVAINQVAVNGRAAACFIDLPHAEVPRAKALTTLTVHKFFRRAEIERQQLRFDEGLPSGQDVSFAFSYILSAARFLMLGGYDYYYLTQHVGNPNEPAHLSRRAKSPEAIIEKNERILGSMLMALWRSDLPDAELRKTMSHVTLPRLLMQEGYLKAVVDAGPDAGAQALGRLSTLLADPRVAALDPPAMKGVTREHLTAIVNSDWSGLAHLLSPSKPRQQAERPSAQPEEPRLGIAGHWVARGRLFVDRASGRARHRRVVNQLALLRQSVEDIQETQRRLEATLQAQLRPVTDSSDQGGCDARRRETRGA